jgi:hypothetical protein
MAVREADKALDAWLSKELERVKGFIDEIIVDFRENHDPLSINRIIMLTGRIQALQDTQAQLHELWGSSLEIGGSDEENKAG